MRRPTERPRATRFWEGVARCPAGYERCLSRCIELTPSAQNKTFFFVFRDLRATDYDLVVCNSWLIVVSFLSPPVAAGTENGKPLENSVDQDDAELL